MSSRPDSEGAHSLSESSHIDTASKSCDDARADRPLHEISPSPPVTATAEEEQGFSVVITRIRAVDGLRQLPTGLYVVVHHRNLTWRTELKYSSVSHDVVEWSGPIPIPSALSETICLEVYASFECQHVLGVRERLRRLTVTTGELLGNSTQEMRVTNIAHDALLRYQSSGQKQHLERSVERFKRTLNLCSPSVVARSNLAKLILCHVENRGAFLGELIPLHCKVPKARPVGNVSRPSMPVPLNVVHLTRLKKSCHEKQLMTFMLQLHATNCWDLGQQNELSLERGSMSSLTNKDLSIFSDRLLERFERFGELVDLEQAVATLRSLVGSTPVWDHRYCTVLCSLGVALKYRFNRLGETSDLEDVILTHSKAIDLMHLGDPEKPAQLNNLGNSLVTRFDRFGELADLEKGIAVHIAAADLTPPGHPDKPACLNNLGLSYRTRFDRLGDLGDLENAIAMHIKAIDLTPSSHPDRSSRLNSLGNSFITRFDRLGELGDMEKAIATHREAIDLTPPGHPGRPGRLNSLGLSFRTRFHRLGELSDMEKAIVINKEAVDLTLPGHPDRPGRLNNLGVSFRTRFDCLRELSDLERAITMHMEATDLTPPDHPDRPSRLNNLGVSFKSRFDCLGGLSDLEKAISAHTKAADLTPPPHPDKAGRLNNLGNSLVARFDFLGELCDLEKAISMHMGAVNLTPTGHPDKPSHLNNLGLSFVTRFECLWELRDLESAISVFSHASSTPFGPIRQRFKASQHWISCARHIQHPSLLCAYSVAVNLLPQLAWIGLSFSHRYSELLRGADIVREAAAAALDAKLPELAVEWLERGRSIVWGELFQLRNSYQELIIAHPDHARKLQELSTALDQVSTVRERSLSAALESTESASQSLQQEADNHRALAIERDKLLEEIREFPGFQGFLRHKLFSLLRGSAHVGPIIILNAADNRCDALAVLPNVDHVIHVPLLNLTYEGTARLRNMMKGLTRDSREGRPASSEVATWESLLPPLWRCVVKPVLDALAFSPVPGNPPRIFWCPTGPFAFLPIHAAGFYDRQYKQPGHKVFDLVVSSYVPSLTTLALSPSSVAVPANDVRLLIVPQPSSDGQLHLPGVVAELYHVEAAIRASPSAHIRLVKSSLGTVEEVLDLMKDADWVHFACHGVQDGVDSGLCLADGHRLKVRDLAALSRPRGGLAFLSACQTAKGEERLPDEAIHIAAAMLSAGYGGVVGTMWSISDRLAPVVARDVYDYLFRKDTRPDHREAARALHVAVASIRDSVDFAEWVPFIHVGL